jgi:hypothetical protein
VLVWSKIGGDRVQSRVVVKKVRIRRLLCFGGWIHAVEECYVILQLSCLDDI